MSPKDKTHNSTANLHKKLNIPVDDVNLDEDSHSINADIPQELLDHPSYQEIQSQLTQTEERALQAEEKATHAQERMLRIKADLDNVQRRVKQDIENAHKYALENFSADLLPIVDSLEKAAEVTQEEGVNLTLKLFHNALEKYNISQIDPLQQAFNPELHQAVSTQVDPNVNPGTVIAVLQKGYTLNNRLIRPALVVVSKSA